MISLLNIIMASCLNLSECSIDNNIKNSEQKTIVNNLENQSNIISSNREISYDITSASSNTITLTDSGLTNRVGNRILNLNIYVNGRYIKSYTTVSGRTHTQNRNRSIAGRQAPLPDGTYSIDRYPVRGKSYEAGRLFLPIRPLFRTARSSLGIHHDPSFGKSNGQDGTSGCLAFANKKEFNQFLKEVKMYNIKYLQVNI